MIVDRTARSTATTIAHRPGSSRKKFSSRRIRHRWAHTCIRHRRTVWRQAFIRCRHAGIGAK